MGAPESELDRLFSLPLAEFVAERKRIGRALAQAGQREEARAVDKIPRPTVSAWAVNQVARREPTLVRRLAELTERLRGTQGRPDEDFGAMTAEHRQTLSSLRDAVDRVLAEGGHDPGPQLVRRVITNLRAGVADAETRPLVEKGRLVRDVGEADFTTLFEALPPPASPSAAPAARHRPKSDDDDTEVRHQEKDRAQRAAERERDKARASAERRLIRLREDAAKARDRLADEERTVAAARAALSTKEEHLARTRAGSEEADAAVAEVEAELARLDKL